MFSAMVKGQTYWLRNTLSDHSIFFQIIVQREYDTQQWSVLHQRIEDSYRRILGSGKIPIIIDAGANIGLSARWFATRYPHARVYAVEPDEANLLVLRRNSQGFPNINVVRGALWDCETKLHIANPNAGSASFRAAEGAGTIPAYTIPDLVSGIFGELLIVKVDIEGGEEAVFRSNTEWVSQTSLIIIELHDWLYPGQGTSRSFLRKIGAQKVDFLIRGENVFCFKHQ